MAPPRITVVIPTRERHDVLAKALRTVVEQDYGDLEIIVSDNFSTDATADVVRSINDERVRYLNTGRRLSMTHNWEFALSHVEEGWVTVIGDDDGLLPGSVRRIADIAARAEVEAVRSDVCTYAWPSLLGRPNGHLVVPLRRGSEVREASRWLTKVMHGAASYAALPMLYTGGYVHSRVLERIKKATGAIYRSRIPDVYSAIAIASCIHRYLYVREPLAINGASRHSTGTAQFTPTVQQTAARLFASEPNIAFHADFPPCGDGGSPPSFQALVYESYLQSAALRPPTAEGLHAHQLELVLAEESLDRAAVAAWARSFAGLHGLDFERAQARAATRRRLTHPRRFLERLWNFLNSYALADMDVPVNDVYEAAVAASAICANRPNRLRRLADLLPRAAKAALRG